MPNLGRWMAIDPLAEKHPDWTPYNYVLANPLRFTDPDGRQVDQGTGYNNAMALLNQLKRSQLSEISVTTQSPPWFDVYRYRRDNANALRATGFDPTINDQYNRPASGGLIEDYPIGWGLVAKAGWGVRAARVGRVGSLVERETLDRFKSQVFSHADEMNLLGRSDRPATVAGILEANGNIVLSRSGSIDNFPLTNDMIELLQSLPGGFHCRAGGCAEIHALNQIYKKGIDLSGSKIFIVGVRGSHHQKPYIPCSGDSGCQALLDKLGVQVVY